MSLASSGSLCACHGHEQLMCLQPGPRVAALHGLDPKPLREMKPLQRREQETNCGIIIIIKKYLLFDSDSWHRASKILGIL